MSGWVHKLEAASVKAESLLCVGLDPDPRRMPVPDVLDFNRQIIDATHDLVCAYKPQMAFYEALGLPGLQALDQTLQHIRKVAPGAVLVGDAKRGDTASTAEAYARAMFDVWAFDVVTVHAYLGRDSLEPFLARPDRGILVVCRTSNRGARDLQDLRVSGSDFDGPLYEHVANMAAGLNDQRNIGLVVGATYPEELAALRKGHPDMPFLVPGVGAQGGDAAIAARLGADATGRGLMIASSRQILYASDDPAAFAGAARDVASNLRLQINMALSA